MKKIIIIILHHHPLQDYSSPMFHFFLTKAPFLGHPPAFQIIGPAQRAGCHNMLRLPLRSLHLTIFLPLSVVRSSAEVTSPLPFQLARETLTFPIPCVCILAAEFFPDGITGGTEARCM